MAEKNFPEMNFDERVAWARGFIALSVGDGSFQNAVWVVCHQFTLWPTAKAHPPLRAPRSKYKPPRVGSNVRLRGFGKAAKGKRGGRKA